ETHTVVPVDGGFAIAPVEEVKSVVNQGVTEIKQEPTQAKPKTDAKQINTIGSKEDGLIASKFREDLKSFLTKIDEIDGYENEPSDLHKFSTILTNEILQKRAKNQDDLKGFISKSLDMALDESNYVGLEGAFNDRSRINAVEEFLYEKAKSTGSLSFENKEGDLVKKDEPIVTKVEQPIIDDPSGDYVHSQFPDATATVTKTDKGYDIDWGDEVESFTGKNAAIKAKASLIKEKFNKKKPKQDGDGGVTIEPMPKKPVSPTNTTQTTPKTTPNTVVERVKNGEEIVYKQPAAIDSNKKSVFEALTRYGWSLDAVLGGVSKTFAGLAEAGAISDGSRNLNADFDSRERYLAVTDNDAPTGGAIIPETEIDLRDYGYNAEAFAKAAKAFNEKVEAYVLKRRELAQQSEQNDGNWVKPDMSNQSTQTEQRVEKETEIKDESKKEL
ncbi:MAG TPA: hypothetical protein PLN40_13550, partial [Agitococcus sp.]|nr:hypothetical protein [Agitococcus sp.]